MVAETLGTEFDRSATAAENIPAALDFLYQAWNCAKQCDRDVREFAVEIRVLESLGLSRNDCRGLISSGHVKQAPRFSSEDVRGTTGPPGELFFSEQTRFVLTESGARFAQSILPRTAGAVGEGPAAAGHHPAVEPPAIRAVPAIPHWDVRLRELHLAGRLVKRFRVPSPNQEAILAAFEEEAWPELIDDPLPPEPGKNPKRRVHDTIKNLNRHQANRLLRFYGDGTGKGIRWEFRSHKAARLSE